MGEGPSDQWASGRVPLDTHRGPELLGATNPRKQHTDVLLQAAKYRKKHTEWCRKLLGHKRGAFLELTLAQNGYKKPTLRHNTFTEAKSCHIS